MNISLNWKRWIAAILAITAAFWTSTVYHAGFRDVDQALMDVSTVLLEDSILAAAAQQQAEKEAAEAARAIQKTLALAKEKADAQKKAEEVKKASAQAEPKTTPPISYTAEEQKMLEYIVQQEVRDATLKHKRVIASVIVNRVKSSKFPNSITKVLTQKNQFTSIDNYYNKRYKPDADTKQAVSEVLTGKVGDTSDGALYFYAPKWASKSASRWFERDLKFLFEMEGHRFFK